MIGGRVVVAEAADDTAAVVILEGIAGRIGHADGAVVDAAVDGQGRTFAVADHAADLICAVGDVAVHRDVGNGDVRTILTSADDCADCRTAGQIGIDDDIIHQHGTGGLLGNGAVAGAGEGDVAVDGEVLKGAAEISEQRDGGGNRLAVAVNGSGKSNRISGADRDVIGQVVLAIDIHCGELVRCGNGCSFGGSGAELNECHHGYHHDNGENKRCDLFHNNFLSVNSKIVHGYISIITHFSSKVNHLPAESIDKSVFCAKSPVRGAHRTFAVFTAARRIFPRGLQAFLHKACHSS